jgi:hypothetical protein
MGYETGAVKWAIGMLLTPVGFISLYIFGGGIWGTVTDFEAVLHTIQYVEQPQRLVFGLVEIYVPTPDALVESLIVYPVTGAIIGATLWYSASKDA